MLGAGVAEAGRLVAGIAGTSKTMAAAGFILAAATILAWPLAPAAAAAVVAQDARIAVANGGTEFELTLSKGVTVEVFTLANPYRVILDMPDVTFRLPKNSGQTGEGLIQAYRYGLFAARKARIVIDTRAPVTIETASMVNGPGNSVRLKVRLAEITAAEFGVGTGATRSASVKKKPRNAAGASPNARPVIVIDPGHGGIDPGALGKDVYEKDVVLAVAKVLRSELKKRGAYQVEMTRTEDVFVSLDKRLEYSEAKNADLFISLHADAIADRRFVSQVSGATVYTLSERASDETARQMAEKENNADAIAGLPSMQDEDVGDVRDILIDLVRRETANFSADFSNVLVGRLGESVSLSSKPQRSAAFKVLRQTSTPSVLVELGYLSNRQDEKKLSSAEWRKSVSKAIANAVDAYFDRRTALAR